MPHDMVVDSARFTFDNVPFQPLGQDIVTGLKQLLGFTVIQDVPL